MILGGFLHFEANRPQRWNARGGRCRRRIDLRGQMREMRHKWQEWEERMIDELRECGNGTVTTLAKLMDAVSGAEHASSGEMTITEEELNRLDRALEADAGTCGIILDRRMSADQNETPVYEREFAVYNSTAAVKCPRCGGTNTPRILPKNPNPSASVRKCADCGKQFGNPPVIVSKNSRREEDYRDEVVSVEFVMREIFGGCTRILIRKNAEGALVEVSEETTDESAASPFITEFGETAASAATTASAATAASVATAAESDAAASAADAIPASAAADAIPAASADADESDGMSGSRQISAEEWDRILHTLYMRFYLNDWNKGYDSFLPGGPRWELKLKLSGRRQRNYHGSRDMTPYFKDLMKLMLGLF